MCVRLPLSRRPWLSLQAQRLSVALHLAAAWEIAVELGLQVSESGALSPDDYRMTARGALARRYA